MYSKTKKKSNSKYLWDLVSEWFQCKVKLRKLSDVSVFRFRLFTRFSMYFYLMVNCIFQINQKSWLYWIKQKIHSLKDLQNLLGQNYTNIILQNLLKILIGGLEKKWVNILQFFPKMIHHKVIN